MKTPSRRSQISHERWLVSYADLITLLFAFFVVLYAFAKADEKQHKQVAAAIDSGFRSLSIVPASSRSIAETGDGASFTRGSQDRIDVSLPTSVLKNLEDVRRDLMARLSPQIAKKAVFVQFSPDGLVISLREAGFFDSAQAAPRPETRETLDQIAGAIRGTPYEVRVEGHTDNVPIHNSAFDSNWELSSARATSIARVLLQLQAIRPEQLSAAGFAEFHPVASNSTPEGRAENRRVDLVIAPHTSLRVPQTDEQASSGLWHTISEQ